MTTLPVIHLNGNSRETLLKDYFQAYKAAKAALVAFMDIDFHARDYYVISDEAYGKAKEERFQHAEHLRDLIAYLEEHVESLNKDNK